MENEQLKLSEKYKVVENIYSDVKEWLKFAESKNAALLALNSATFFGIIRIFTKDFNELTSTCLGKLMFICLIVSFLVSLTSFYPRKAKHNSKTSISLDSNLLFYGNIVNASPKKIYFLFNRKYLQFNKKYLRDSDVDKYISDLCFQIYALSYLTVFKNNCFKISSAFFSFAYLLLVLNTYFLLGR